MAAVQGQMARLNSGNQNCFDTCALISMTFDVAHDIKPVSYVKSHTADMIKYLDEKQSFENRFPEGSPRLVVCLDPLQVFTAGDLSDPRLVIEVPTDGGLEALIARRRC